MERPELTAAQRAYEAFMVHIEGALQAFNSIVVQKVHGSDDLSDLFWDKAKADHLTLLNLRDHYEQIEETDSRPS